MPHILSFVSQKGGVGKSTLARAAAVALAKEGYRVRLCDLDTQQGTSIEWYRRRLNRGGEALASVEYYATVRQALQSGIDMNPAFDVLVVDAPGRSSDATVDLALHSHLVIQPATGTLDDLQPGVLLFHTLLKNRVQPDRLLFALTRTSTDHEETLAKEYLQQAGYAVLTATLPEKAGYKAAQNEGQSITETLYPSLNAKAQELLDEIFARVHALAEATATT